MNRRGKIKYVLRAKVKTRHLKPSYILKKRGFRPQKNIWRIPYEICFDSKKHQKKS